MWPLIEPEEVKLTIYNPLDNTKSEVLIKTWYPGTLQHPAAVAYSDSFLYVMTYNAARKHGAHVGLFATTQGIEPFSVNVIANPHIRNLLYVRASDPWDVLNKVIRLIAEKRARELAELLEVFGQYRYLAAEHLVNKLRVVPLVVERIVKESEEMTELFIGSMKVRVPRSVLVSERVIDLTRKSAWSVEEIAAIVEAFVAAAVQEKENSVVFKSIFGEVEIYDPGPAQVPEELLQVCKRAAERLKCVHAVTTTEHIPVVKVAEPIAPAARKFGNIILAEQNVLVVLTQLEDHVYIYCHAPDVFTGYLKVVELIKSYGVKVETRHGATRDVCLQFLYERLPRVDIEIRQDGTVEVVDVEDPPEVVKDVVYRLTTRSLCKRYLKDYVSDILNGVLGEAEYTYGSRLRRFGVQYEHTFSYALPKQKISPVLHNTAEILDLHAKLSKAVRQPIDQLELVVKKLVKDRNARYAVACTWDVLTDGIGAIADPPCWIIIQFRLFGNKLVTYTYCRSHDFARAHIENMYFIAAVAEYVRKRLSKELETEIKLGSCSGLIASCHIYVSRR